MSGNVSFDSGTSTITVSIEGAPGPRGGQGNTGGNVMAAGLFTDDTSQSALPDGAKMVHTAGNAAPGVGAAFYAQRPDVDAGYVAAHPLSSKMFAGGKGVAIAEIVYTPEMFGALGNGALDANGKLIPLAPATFVADDTAAWQAAIDTAALTGGKVQGRAGAIYGINPTANAPFQVYGGVNIRSNVTLDGNGCTLAAFANNSPGYSLIVGYKASGFFIDNIELRGDRQEHTGTNGEFGHCLTLFACTNFRLGAKMKYSRAWGDAWELLGSFTTNANGSVTPNGDFCTNFTIERGWQADNCRRNGASIIAARNGFIGQGIVTNINGTAPMAALDFEPDNAAYPNMDLVYEAPICSNVQSGVALTVGNVRVNGSGNGINAINTGYLVVAGAVDCHFKAGSIFGGAPGGVEGGPVRFVGGNAQKCSVKLTELTGGGTFAVETLAGDDVRIERNRIAVTNAGCAGPARVLGGTFLDNECLLDTGTGVAGVQHVQLYCTFGRNRFFSNTNVAVGNALLSGTDLGGDYYANGLKRQNGTTGLTPGVKQAQYVPNVAGGGIAGGASVPITLNGDFVNNVCVAFVSGNGEGGADPTNIRVTTSYRGTDKITYQIKNIGSAPQSADFDYIKSGVIAP